MKSLLDVPATVEALETLGVPVIGFRTDAVPLFYVAEVAAGADPRRLGGRGCPPGAGRLGAGRRRDRGHALRIHGWTSRS